MAQFSNTDRYLVTYSYPQGPGDPGHIVIWDVERSISIQQQVAHDSGRGKDGGRARTRHVEDLYTFESPRSSCLEASARSHTPKHKPKQVALRSWPAEPYGKGNYFKWSADDKHVAIGKSKYLREGGQAAAAAEQVCVCVCVSEERRRRRRSKRRHRGQALALVCGCCSSSLLEEPIRLVATSG